ncbi:MULTISPECIES: 23S rRNA (adenine(2030)-N(6))-methyltransferase RlmJ [Rhodomicrobium]|uniref:23S rRNA (adenine(2030)-N(6))-methyltransferase RlmJ n=1 Tax=Rhodomicrobium TaxID=1068 RepID=UPI000B4B0FA8|nr:MULTISPECIES: 23S rRNA (adenine(2030)-N(6))-methyltransferase RlmJ [Rhodomicrobium]
MNYRHLYHAGNFADVLKHLVLTLCVDYLQRKDGPLCFLDTHGGAGLYDLASSEAQKTGEWQKGIGLLKDSADAPEDLRLYLDLIRPDLDAGTYPGSPLIIARRLRAQDRLIASELHGETFEALQSVLAPYPGTRVLQMDAYESARAHLPPQERRGLVLVDPPFELKSEFETLIRQMREWKKRWATGVFLLWFPIKAHLPVAELKAAARALALPRTWCVELLMHPRERAESFNGSGLIVFNAPFGVPERVEVLLPYLRQAMSLHATASGWEVPPV